MNRFKLLIFVFLLCGKTFATSGFDETNLALQKQYEKLEKEASEGLIDSQYRLFLLVTRNEPYLNDKVESAFQQIIKAGQSGHTEAQFTIGSLYQTGYIVKQDRKVAFGWLSEAAKKGHTESQVLLASNLAYQHLESVSKIEKNDYFNSAGLWYQKAIDSGSVRAKSLYGLMLLHNNTDSKLGLDLITQAADQGDVSSMHSLGVHYKHQWRKNRELSFFELSKSWYRKSLEAGYVEAKDDFTSVISECKKHHKNNDICNL